VGSLKLVLGVLLVGLGVVLLAGRLGYLPSDLTWMFRWWPALLVILGLALLAGALRNPLLGWLATLAVIAALAFGVWWAHRHGGAAPTREVAKTFDLNRPRAETLTLRARVFGGSIQVEPNAPARARHLDLITTGTESGSAEFTSSGGAAILDWPDEDARVYQAPIGGNLRVLVPERTGIRLLAKSLFARVRASFPRLKPELCEVNAIASSVQIDATGPARPSLVRIAGTLSNVELWLPANCPARLEFLSPLSLRSVPDDFTEHVGGRSRTKIWTSEGSGPPVLVRVEGPFVHLKVRREPVRAL